MSDEPKIIEMRDLALVLGGDSPIDQQALGTFVIRANHESEISIIGRDEYQFIEQGNKMHRPPIQNTRSAALRLIATVGSMLFGAEIASRLAADPYGNSHKRHRRRLTNYVNAENNRERRRAIYQTRSAYQNAVNSLTNHERNLWARAGYPGQTGQKIEAVLVFSIKKRLAKLAERR